MARVTKKAMLVGSSNTKPSVRRRRVRPPATMAENVTEEVVQIKNEGRRGAVAPCPRPKPRVAGWTDLGGAGPPILGDMARYLVVHPVDPQPRAIALSAICVAAT